MAKQLKQDTAANGGVRQLTQGKIWCFALGQFGWSLLAALISSYVTAYYVPDANTIEAGQPLFIHQGAIFLGITILGLITGIVRVFDAVTDPLIGSMSDRCKSKDGRRIPFMRAAAIPFGLATVLTFWSPVNSISWVNALFLFVMMMLFYLFMTMYCSPFNALIPELGTTQKTRMSISTTISFTYIAGMAIAYTAPTLWGIFQSAFGMSRVTAIRTVFTILSVIGTACLFIPVFTIKEKDYVTAQPSQSTAFKSLKATFRNGDFRLFVASDIIYFLGITTFQTAMLYYVTSLLKLDEGMSTLFFVVMTALSVLFYPMVMKLTPKYGKKKLILVAFCIFIVAFGYTACLGLMSFIPPVVQGFILCVLAAPAMAIFGILPQAVVADIAQCDEMETKENRAGMFYAARTFAMKMGQAVAMIVVASLAIVGKDTGLGYRLTAVVAAAACVAGGLIFSRYNEKRIYEKIIKE
ncbi:MAG: MFS transporter [Clostridia bacterium]|nr:MFS transporter [Clostridia bacterium]